LGLAAFRYIQVYSPDAQAGTRTIVFSFVPF
jgi:hypothetical protein